MDSFSVASLCSLCSSISHSAIATSAEIADLLSSIPGSQHIEQLSSLSEALQEFSVSIGHFEASVKNASTISTKLQQQIGSSLDVCQQKLSPLGKQVMRLQPDNVSRLNGAFLRAHEDLLVVDTQLLGYFNETLVMTHAEDQDAALDGTEGRAIVEQTSDATRMLSKAGDILIDGNNSTAVDSSTGHAIGKDEQPPPYTFEASAASSSAAAGPSNSSRSEGGSSWGSTLMQGFKALTVGLRAKPDPMVTGLCEASRRGDVTQIAAFLKEGANIDGKNEDGNTALQVAILADQASTARCLLGLGASTTAGSKMPPMFLAASIGSVDVARMLYERGDEGSDVKKTSISGQPYFVDVVSSGNLDGVRFLLERGAKAKAESIAGRPVLVQAAKKGDVEMVRLLLDFGAKVDSNDISGNSILAIAIEKSDTELFELLLSRGAKLNSKTVAGERVLSLAIRNGNIHFAKRLLEAGADGNIEDRHGQRVIVGLIKENKMVDEEKVALVRMLLRNGAKATSKDIYSDMHLLPTAIEKNADERIISMLIDHGADTSKRLNNGETLLTQAIMSGRLKQVKSLLEHGADANQPNKSGKMPMMQALVKQEAEIVRLLVQHGAHVDAAGGSARDFANALGNTDILEALGLEPASGTRAARHDDAPPGYEAAVSGKN